MNRKILIRKDDGRTAGPQWLVSWLPAKPNHRGIFYRPEFRWFQTWAEAVDFVRGCA